MSWVGGHTATPATAEQQSRNEPPPNGPIGVCKIAKVTTCVYAFVFYYVGCGNDTLACTSVYVNIFVDVAHEYQRAIESHRTKHNEEEPTHQGHVAKVEG